VSTQVTLVPVQTSATSQTPAAARHVNPALPAACAHVPAWHLSVVQTFPSSVHVAPSTIFASVGHASADPVHLSSTSHSPTADRHTKLAGCFASGHAVDVPLQ
jgi:hypothetical protein